ncbi:MAG: hypothetical protein KDD43_08025, partial [Bdellovibrionales bacterium]|nr:hypothetical protein [Bdellovibrionales bacterium]
MIRDKRDGKRFRPKRQRFLFIGSAALLGLTLLLFQNCQSNYLIKVAQLAIHSTASEASTVETPLASPFSDGKLQVSWTQLLEDAEFRQRNQSAFARVSDSIFSLGSTLPLGLSDPLPDESSILVDENQAVFLPGQAMVVLVDNNCRKGQSGTSTFSADLEDPSLGRPQIDVEAYSYDFKDPLPVSQFKSWLEDDPCIIGASEDLEVSVNETILNDDPMFDNLTHLSAIDYV